MIKERQSLLPLTLIDPRNGSFYRLEKVRRSRSIKRRISKKKTSRLERSEKL